MKFTVSLSIGMAMVGVVIGFAMGFSACADLCVP